MGSMEKSFVHYCCVAKGGKILQAYSGNNGGEDSEIEKLAALCLEKAPQYHRWYSESRNKRSYCFLMEDGFIYFVIADDGLGNAALIRFLEHVRSEFKKIAKRGSRLSWKGKGKGGYANANLNSGSLQDQLVPVIRQLITSLQNVAPSSKDAFNPSASPCDGCYGEVVEGAGSTKAPLLGNKSGKQEKKSGKQEKKAKDHVISMRGIELEEHCKSSDRGLRTDSGSVSTGAAASPASLQKDMSPSMRRRSSSQSVRRSWCRLVRVVLAIDAAVCIVLLAIWLVICKGIQCLH